MNMTPKPGSPNTNSAKVNAVKAGATLLAVAARTEGIAPRIRIETIRSAGARISIRKSA